MVLFNQTNKSNQPVLALHAARGRETAETSWRSDIAGCGITLWACRNFTGLHVRDNRSTPRRMLKKSGLLTRPTPARQDAPFRGQGRNSAVDPRFTFHASRFTAAGSAARTPLADCFSILIRSNRMRAKNTAVKRCGFVTDWIRTGENRQTYRCGSPLDSLSSTTTCLARCAERSLTLPGNFGSSSGQAVTPMSVTPWSLAPSSMMSTGV